MTFDYNNPFFSYEKRFETIVFKPKDSTELQHYLMESLVALRNNKAVIFNFEYIEYLPAQRILDSLAGATYALKGDKTCIAEKLYFFVPHKVTLEVEGGNRDGLLYY